MFKLWCSSLRAISSLFLGRSWDSLCGLKSQNLSFPVIVYRIILVLGCKKKKSHSAAFPSQLSHITLLLGKSFTQCENHTRRFSLSPFSCLQTVFQPFFVRRGRLCRDSVTVQNQNARKRNWPILLNVLGNCVSHHILWFKALPRISKLTHWACSVKGGERGV